MRQAACYLAPFREENGIQIRRGGRLSVQRLFTYEVNSVERGDPEAGCSISVVLSRAINRGEIARVGSMELNKVTRKGIIELANQP